MRFLISPMCINFLSIKMRLLASLLDILRLVSYRAWLVLHKLLTIHLLRHYFVPFYVQYTSKLVDDLKGKRRGRSSHSNGNGTDSTSSSPSSASSPSPAQLQEAYNLGAEHMKRQFEESQKIKDMTENTANAQHAENTNVNAHNLIAQEEEQLAAAREIAEGMQRRQHKVSTRPTPCVSERTAVLECFNGKGEAKEGGNGTTECRTFVESFFLCTEKAKSEMFSR